MLDQLDTFSSTDDEASFLAAIHLLAPATTTVVVGTPVPTRAVDAPHTGSRTVQLIDLYTLESLSSAKGGN